MKNLSHLNIDNEKPPFNNVDRYIEESNGDKYLIR